MANSFIGVPTDGTGKKIDTWTVGTNHRQAIVIGDSAGTAVAPVSTSLGLSVNVTNATAIPISDNSSSLTVDGTVAVSSGTVVVSSGTVTVTAATVSGTVAVSTINSKSPDFAAGTATTNTLRVTVDSGQLGALGPQLPSACAPVVAVSGGAEYQYVAASATTTNLGTGAAGDYLQSILVIPTTVSPGGVSITDGTSTTRSIFAGGTTSLTALVPFTIPFGIISTSGAWKVTTGTGLAVVATGNFT